MFEVVDLMIALLLFVLAIAFVMCIREIYVRRTRENQRRTNEQARRLFDDEDVTLMHHQYQDDTVDSYHININHLAYKDDMVNGRITKGDYVAYCGGRLIESRISLQELLNNTRRIDYSSMPVGGPVFIGKAGDSELKERAF